MHARLPVVAFRIQNYYFGSIFIHTEEWEEGTKLATESELPRVLTVSELADYLHVHQSTIYRMLKRNELPSFKVGADYRFNREEIDRWRFGQMTPR